MNFSTHAVNAVPVMAHAAPMAAAMLHASRRQVLVAVVAVMSAVTGSRAAKSAAAATADRVAVTVARSGRSVPF